MLGKLGLLVPAASLCYRGVALSQPVPLYRQIAADLRRQIEYGELSPGSQLPTEDDLRALYKRDQSEEKVSRNTVRAAIDVLISLGLVETRPGQGTFVLSKVV